MDTKKKPLFNSLLLGKWFDHAHFGLNKRHIRSKYNLSPKNIYFPFFFNISSCFCVLGSCLQVLCMHKQRKPSFSLLFTVAHCKTVYLNNNKRNKNRVQKCKKTRAHTIFDQHTKRYEQTQYGHKEWSSN